VSKEDSVLWEREIPWEIFQVLGISNYGHLFLRGPEGVYVYESNGQAMHEPIGRWSRQEMATTSSQLGAVKVSADGKTVVVERTTLHTRMSQKIFEFLSSTQVEPNTTIHELIFHNIVEDTTKRFYQTMSSVKSPQKFLWNMSLDFEWLIMAEPQKNQQVRFSVVHVQSQTIYHEFAIPDLRVHALAVSRDGTALVDVSQGEERGIVIVTIDGKRSTVTSPTNYQVLHLANSFVALKTQPVPFMLIKGFDDRLITQADLRPLDRLDMQYDVHFNEKDSIDLMSMSDTSFKVIHTSLEFLETDSRRWQKVADTAESEKAYQEEAKAEAARQAANPKKRQVLEIPTRPTMQPLLSTDGLTSAVSDEPPPATRAPVSIPAPLSSTPPAAVPPSAVAATPVTSSAEDPERSRVERLLTLLEERFLQGQVSEATYLELREKYRAKLT
jgi:hypothetical protein